ncbi:hypothetical protein BDV93DRAFT_558527 [Ceratobasidium sp. AG-I]|nr:hypothetical protein BDV93DRAFT_558527 [Ceratobasidium sp. AG-I]
MDATTSRTLAWMISNSEVPSSVDHALQAIAGTSFEMPNEALWECEVSHVIYSRLRPCLDIRDFGLSSRLTTVQLKRIIESDSSILAYSLVLNLMASERRELTITNLDTADRPNDASVWLDYCENFLRTHSSPHMSAIGYAARGLRFWCGTLYEHDRSSHLLKVSNLGVLAWEQQDTQSSTLHFMIFTAMCREAIYWDASSLELVAQRPQILRNMIVIISHAAEVDLSSNEFMRGLCAVGLAMNRHTDTRFGEVATHFFASDNQVKILQKLGNSCGVLGVSGLLCALKSDGLYESLQESALKPFFDLLWTYVADKGALVELPSDALENLGIARRIFETIYDCRQCLTRRDISIESLDEVLGYMLRHEHEPWLTPIAAVLLEESANYSLLDDCVRFVAQNDPRETETGTVLLSNAFYEAAQHETASPVSADNILRLTQHFDVVCANEGKDIHVVIRALLQRLLDNDMFYCLLLLMGRTRTIGTLTRWQGTRVGPVVRFWGEHTIVWAHSVQRESGSSDIAERLRESLSNREPGIVSEQVLEDAADLVNLLERKINQPENSSFTLYDRSFKILLGLHLERCSVARQFVLLEEV